MIRIRWTKRPPLLALAFAALCISLAAIVLNGPLVHEAAGQTGITCEPALSLGGPAVIEAEPGSTVTIPFTASVTVANATFVDLSVAIGQPAGLAIVYSPSNQSYQTAASSEPQTFSFDGEINARIPDDATPGSNFVFDSNSAQATCFGPDNPDGISATAFGNAVEIVPPGQAPPPTEPPTPTEPSPPTPTQTQTPEPTPTPEPEPTATPTPTEEPEPTATPEPSPTEEPTATPTTTPSPTGTLTPTATGSPTVTATPGTATTTATEDDGPATSTPEATDVASPTPTPTASPTPTQSRTQALILDITERRMSPTIAEDSEDPVLRAGLATLGILLAVAGGYSLLRSRGG